MPRSVRVNDKTYRKLVEEAGVLQAQLKRPVSIDETIWHLLKRPKEFNRISDLAGSWDITDRETREIEKSLRRGWRGWRIRRSA